MSASVAENQRNTWYTGASHTKSGSLQYSGRDYDNKKRLGK